MGLQSNSADEIAENAPNGWCSRASDQNHRGFAGGSEDPRLAQFMVLIATEPEPGILQLS